MNNKKIHKIIIAAGLAVTTIGGNALTAFADGTENKENIKIEQAQAVEYAKVSIKVKNEYTGKLMKDTVVNVNGINLKTNDKGIIEEIPMQAGHYNPITVSKEGFEKVTLKTTIFEANKNYMEIANLAPETASHVVTFIDRANGQPVKNTKVDIGGTEMTTNEMGKITMTGLWGGNQKFNVKVDGFDSTTLAFKAEVGKVGETTLEVNPIAKYARVSIKVRNARTGEMIKNTELDVNGAKLKTNNDGVIEDMPVQAGYENPITVSKDGFQSTTLKTTIFEANKNYEEEINLSPEMVKHTIKIVDRVTGKPVANTNVTVGGVKFTTDEDGKLILEKLWEGNQEFEVKVNGYDTTNVSFKTEIGKEGETTLEVNPVARYARVSIKVRNAQTGDLMKNTELNVNGIKLKTNSDGVIEDMPVQAGHENPITVGKDGFQNTTLKTTIFEADKNYEEEINLAPETASHVVTFISRETGQAIANTKVSISGVEMTTDSEGRVTLGGLWEGAQSFEVKIGGFDTATLKFNADADKEGQSTIEMERDNNFVVLPGVIEPTKPETEKPDVEKPVTPETEKPDVEKPVIPETEKPNVEKPDVEKPVVSEKEEVKKETTSENKKQDKIKEIKTEEVKETNLENPDTSDKGIMTFVMGIVMGAVALVAINGKKLFKVFKG
ncbi:MAG: hypothetical protein ACRC28_13920 [Clostridium sp.]|uniref:hypothetical protein n=1 Tax=Clostridium sp. TaxID=1506 RepID=UPI003F327D42